MRIVMRLQCQQTYPSKTIYEKEQNQILNKKKGEESWC